MKRTILKTEPQMGRTMEPQKKGRIKEPQSMGRIMEPPKWGRIMEPHRMGRSNKHKPGTSQKTHEARNGPSTQQQKEFKPAVMSKKATNQKKQGKRNTQEKDNIEEIIIMYANANGIGDKAASVQSAAEACEAHVIGIAETKQIPPTSKDTHLGYPKKEKRDREVG